MSVIFSNCKTWIEKIDLAGFFVGWPNPPTEETLKKILHNSQHIYLAIDENKPVVIT